MPPAHPRRDSLLAAAMEHLASRGISDLSLRELADALGTSHRMLTYYFGSKEGLLTEIVRAVEATQRTVWDELIADENLTPSQRPLLLWKRLSAPEMEPYVRLFFEIYGQGLQGRHPAATLLDGDIASWLRPTVATLIGQGASEEDSATAARLGLAVTRGLLLDLAATGDRGAVDRCFELFVSWCERHDSMPDGPPSSHSVEL